MISYKQALRSINPSLVIATGPAGTGKTMNACIQGINHLRNGNFEKLVITRPTVSIDNEQIGHLPGTLESKMEPWLVPIYSHIQDYTGKSEMSKLIYNNSIEVCPFVYMRGRTFKNSFIIADEMQNSSKNQFKTLLTRLHESSKLIVTGDLQQSDICDNGLQDFLNKLPTNYDEQFINISQLTDIERSDFVKYVLSIYSF